MLSPFKATHMVVRFATSDSVSKKALLLRKLAPGMNIVCWTTNQRDAEIVRRTFQEQDKDEEREYAVTAYAVE